MKTAIDLERTLPMREREEPKLAPFLRAGSQEAFKFQFLSSNRNGSQDDIPRRALSVAEKQLGRLDEMSKKLDFKIVSLPK